MYNTFRQTCERLLRIPADPNPPPGDEGSTRIYRAAANYYRYRLFVWAIASAAHLLGPLLGMIVLIIAALIGKEWSFWIPVAALVVLISGAFAVFHLAIVRLDYEKRWYIVTDRSLRVREGVVGVREMTITFANIQNIAISQGPVQRLLSIADLRVETAGGGGSGHQQQGGPNLHTAWFRGIDNASEVRQLIQQRLRKWKDAGLGDHEDQFHAPEQTGTDVLSALREVYGEAKALNAALAVQS